ncbi:hypothetical protein KKF34_10575 [Myxococcota bacterium]|nr:hypothetical protein [Myxococcota bacterium]MBU1380540.1 hypothetical protein [Myxococcota bacterium]MBU1497311.1 hypothetical protein [Myxococcota bacterium]
MVYKRFFKETFIAGLFLYLFLFSSGAAAQEIPGIRSRFSFGGGFQLGFGDQAVIGLAGSARFMGVAGIDLEYDFNRITSTPPRNPREISALQFIPNTKLLGTIYFSRKKRYATYAQGGIGIDLGADYNRSNLIGGAGIEFVYFKDRLVLNVTLRFYFPRPVDVEKQREHLIMDGTPTLPSYTDYYSFQTVQLSISIKYYY